jgi:hypothetical protein
MNRHLLSKTLHSLWESVNMTQSLERAVSKIPPAGGLLEKGGA